MFLVAAATSTLAGIVLVGVPVGAPRRAVADRSPIAEMVDAARYVRSERGLGLVALTTIGVVVIGFPYLTFLPALADERYDVGATGYGVMSGVAGLGAVVAGVILPRTSVIVHVPGAPWRVAGSPSASSLIGLGLAGIVRRWRWWRWPRSGRRAWCSRRPPSR